MAPPSPQAQLLRLPPILRKISLDSMTSYSQAPRGLFVLLPLDGIFTVTAISPGLWLRQCPTRYTFRAGRNLPDKEFRYLRHFVTFRYSRTGWSFLPASAYRYAGRTVSSLANLRIKGGVSGVQSLRILLTTSLSERFRFFPQTFELGFIR